MISRSVAPLLCVTLIVFSTRAWAQAEQRPPRQFPAFVGTWTLDASAGTGHIAGLPVARTLVIATTPTAMSVIKDSATPEVYRFDGSETNIGDTKRRASFTLVAEMPALTTKLTRDQRGHSFTNIITDAYAVTGDVLTVERQLSVLVQPPGNLATLEDPRNNRQTLVYRRNREIPVR